MLGVFLDSRSLDHDDLDLSALMAAVDEWRFYDYTPSGDIATRIADAQIVLTNKIRIDQQHLETAEKLQLICVAATGYNNIDLAAAQLAGVPVCNARGYATPSVAQHVMTLILTLTTSLLPYRQAASDGRWAGQPQFCLLDFPIGELSGKTLGILGMGELGSAVANLSKAFGMDVISWHRPGSARGQNAVPLNELLSACDVVSIHVPLSEQTQGLLGANELARMKPAALLINTARGGIVDETALLNALREGRLGGAAIDVLPIEPPPPGHPLLSANLPNLIVTPHVAWASVESRQRLVLELARNIEAFKSGRVRNEVTADKS